MENIDLGAKTSSTRALLHSADGIFMMDGTKMLLMRLFERTAHLQSINTEKNNDDEPKSDSSAR